MATKVHMEALSPTMEEGQIVKWLKSEGDEVANGDVLAEVETDKATMELVARGEGVLRAVFVKEGGVAPVGDVIGVIAAEDEDIASLVPEGAGKGDGGAPKTDAPPAEKPTEETTEPEATAAEAPAAKEAAAAKPAAPAAADAAPSDGDGRVKASPVARRLAEEGGVALAGVSGSGPGGRIIKRDVEAAIEAGPAEAPAAPAPAAPAAPQPLPDFVAAHEGPEYEDFPLTQMRKTIARRLTESLGPVPHFFLTMDVDMTRTMEARKRINALLEPQGQKVSINDLVIRATAAALRRHPECNAHWMGDSVRRFNRVHIAVAVAIDDGLITPIVRDAHLKGVARIGAEVRELAGRARDKKLKPEEYTGGTFSLSNLGMFGIHEFTAIINPPEAGILAVGAVEETPVAVDGEVVVQPRMRMTMSCDHRVIDGAQGSRFLQTLKAMLEEPAVTLI
jgi:pyruvate dehydrogenase E2 component (dihydrolipoamide acetyltransferase)